MSDPDEKGNPYLGGKMLLAMPSLADPRFHKAVILLCAHDENGAMGLVINHEKHDISFPNLVEQLNAEDAIKKDIETLAIPVMSGGPVEAGRGFLLHSSDFKAEDSVQVDDDICITGSLDAFQKIADGEGPEKLLFILGYAGWGAGQLDSELAENSWLVVNTNPDIIFNDDINGKWEMAARQLGFDPAMLSGAVGRA